MRRMPLSIAPTINRRAYSSRRGPRCGSNESTARIMPDATVADQIVHIEIRNEALEPPREPARQRQQGAHALLALACVDHGAFSSLSASSAAKRWSRRAISRASESSS